MGCSIEYIHQHPVHKIHSMVLVFDPLQLSVKLLESQPSSVPLFWGILAFQKASQMPSLGRSKSRKVRGTSLDGGRCLEDLPWAGPILPSLRTCPRAATRPRSPPKLFTSGGLGLDGQSIQAPSRRKQSRCLSEEGRQAAAFSGISSSPGPCALCLLPSSLSVPSLASGCPFIRASQGPFKGPVAPLFQPPSLGTRPG